MTNISITCGLPSTPAMLLACFVVLFVLILLHGRVPHKLFSYAQSWLQGNQKGSTETNYVDVFPPSQRETLAEVLPGALSPPSRANGLSKSMLLGLKSDYRTAEPRLFIFSGFTVAEVKALGDFPNYAKLTGVPLPSPLVEFNINTALPRPYRPFRWKYHQTMGMCRSRFPLGSLRVSSHGCSVLQDG